MRSLIDQFRSSPSEETMRAIVDEARTGRMKDDEVAYLSTTLAKSGSLRLIPPDQFAVDLASTGGPSSLSTLLGPLFLRALGCIVPKLGVPGRPAGGVDTLAQLPGYRVNLADDEVASCLDRSGYVHFLANDDHAPLDAILFRFRRKTGTQSVPELAIASILAKKIAVGLHRAGLDIRVAPHGNFGASWDEARRNAQRFTRVSTSVGIDSVCFLTDARFPYQPYLGRGESLLALSEVFSGTAELSLKTHASQCLAMACAVADVSGVNMNSRMTEAEKHFHENLLVQGSNPNAFEEYVERVRLGHRFEYVSKDHGFVLFQLDKMRDLILQFQAVGANDATAFPDGIGMKLCKLPGELVQPGELLATIRVPDVYWNSVETRLQDVISVSETLKIGKGFEEVANG